MLEMIQAAVTTLGVVEVATQAVGVPFAAGLATEIVKSCEDVARYKVMQCSPWFYSFVDHRNEQRRAKSLGDKSTLLVNTLTEESHGLEGTVMQERMDEVVA
jgi:hypothetical protein